MIGVSTTDILNFKLALIDLVIVGVTDGSQQQLLKRRRF
jgi:hypothetical protein